MNSNIIQIIPAENWVVQFQNYQVPIVAFGLDTQGDIVPMIASGSYVLPAHTVLTAHGITDFTILLNSPGYQTLDDQSTQLTSV